MLNNTPKPDILDLLEAIQDSTDNKVDEEKGSFKKGDKVIYDMLGGSLTNEDLIITLGVDRHAMRANHNGAVAEITKISGDAVSRYNILFEDGYTINGVAVSEIKAIVEKENFEIGDVVQLTHKRDTGYKIPGFADGVIRQKLGDDRFLVYFTWSIMHKPFSQLANLAVDDIEKVEEFKTNEVKESIDQVIIDAIPEERLTWLMDELNVSREVIITAVLKSYENDLEEGGDMGSLEEWLGDNLDSGFLTDFIPTSEVGESKTNEAEDATQTMRPQEKPAINAEDYHMEDYSDVELNTPEVKVKSKSEKSGNAIRAVEDDELEQKEDEVVKSKSESKVEEVKKKSAAKRNRGDCIFQSTSSKVKDDADHFPINSISQARNALARVNQYSTAPKWYDGSLESLVRIVVNAVKKKYPSIEITKAAEKPGKNESKLKEESDDRATTDKYVVVWRNTLEPEARDRFVDVFAITPQQAEFKARNVLKRSGVDNDVIDIVSVDLEETSLEEEVEVVPSRAGIKKISDEQLKHLHDNSVRSFHHWLGSSQPENARLAGKAVKAYEDELVFRGLIADDGRTENLPVDMEEKSKSKIEEQEKDYADFKDEQLINAYNVLIKRIDSDEAFPKEFTEELVKIFIEIKKRGLQDKVLDRQRENESKFSFMKKQKPLWLCNECFKTFRNTESVCILCESKNVEKIILEGDANLVGFSKKVFAVTWEDIDTGRKESTRVMAFDKADAEREVKKSNRKIIKVELIREKVNKEADSRPFDQVCESVSELVGETPGIKKEEQEILHWAIDKNIISNEWPSSEVMIDSISIADKKGMIKGWLGMEDPEGLDLGEINAVYLKYVLLPKAKKAFEKSISEAHTGYEFEKEGIPVKGKTYYISQRFRLGWPAGNYKVTDVQFLRTVRGDKAKQFQVEGDDKNWWIAGFYRFDEPKVEEDHKKIEPSRTVEIVHSTVDPDVFNIRVVELPKGSIQIMDTSADRKIAMRKGKELARSLNAKFLGIVDETKIKEQEEDTFKTIGKGLEKEDADKLASDKDGQVIVDEEDNQKFAVIVKGK